MNFNLRKSTIFLAVSGSQAYGFASPDSDWDYRGVCIPPLDSYIGILDKFEQIVDSGKEKHVFKHYEGIVRPDADMQVMELSKFAGLAASCNPSVIEILFTDPRDYVLCLPIMDRLIENRQLFLSKAAKPRFCGYALSQLQRIKRHKRWLDNPPTHKPTRQEFGLPERGLLSQDQVGAAEALIQREIDDFMIEQDHLPEDVKIELHAGMGRMMRAIWSSLNESQTYPVGDGQRFETTDEALYWGVAEDQGFSENFLEVLNREKRYRTALREYHSYQHWLDTRNPARAELEKKYGYDTKHATHLVRLIRMAREILEKGEVNVFRPDAAELKEIRAGGWTYEQVVEYAEREDEALNEVVKTSPLPKVPDRQKIHDLVHNMILDFNLGDEDAGETK
jgi:predicted nucleotidyltransferase